MSSLKAYFPKPSLGHILFGVCLIIMSFAHYMSGEVSFWACMPYHTITYGFLAPFILALEKKHQVRKNKRANKTAVLLAFLFAQFVTLGFSFHRHQDLFLCFGNWTNVAIWGGQTLCYGYIFYKIIIYLTTLAERKSNKESSPSSVSLPKWFTLMVVIRLCFFTAFYPCVFGFDAAVGLRTFLDPSSAVCDHHPFLIQLIHGFFFNIGTKMGHPSWGMAMLALLNIIFTSGVILYGLSLLNKVGIGKFWITSVAAIYTFFPLFPYLSINPTKDGIFAYSFLLYIFSLFNIYTTKGSCFRQKNFLCLHGITILLLCLTRHQGFLIVFIEVAILLFCYWNYKKRILLLLLPIFLVVGLYNRILLPYLNVEPGGKQEMYGPFFQQTARYLIKHPNDVKGQEVLAISQVLPYDSITTKYEYDKTDPVKNSYLYNPWYRPQTGKLSMFHHIEHHGEAKALADYRSTWLAMGKRHPLSYIEATMGVCYGFFYNNNRLIIETEPNWENETSTTPEYSFFHINLCADYYNRYVYKLFKKPIINWPFAIAYYNWIAIFLLGLLLYRKDIKGLAIFLPVFVSLLILLICPMIYGRYAYPIVVTLPLFVTYSFTNLNRQFGNDQNCGSNTLL